MASLYLFFKEEGNFLRLMLDYFQKQYLSFKHWAERRAAPKNKIARIIDLSF